MSTFGRAVIASLQIQSTIGFAAPTRDHWAREWRVTIAITFHSVTTVLFNIFLLGTLFARLSSAKNRALSVRISTNAVIRDEEDRKGYPILEFRVGEIRKHQLLNLDISVYLFSHREDKLFHREKLSIEPTGGVFLAVPTEVRHVISETSPLWRLLTDSENTSSQSFDCQMCGDAFQSKTQLVRHLNFIVSTLAEPKHSAYLKTVLAVPPPSLESVKSHMRLTNSYWEIVVMIEGTEPVTGSPIQVRHSFTLDDLLFGAQFKRCWTIEPTTDGKGKKLVVDFDLFNTIE